MESNKNINNNLRPLVGLLITALCALFASTASHSSSLTFFKQMSGLKSKEAITAYRDLYAKSKQLRFLDCPIEMIERQWGGAQSVNLGISYLQEYIEEANEQQPNYASITKRCQHDLRIYRHKSKKEEIVSRAIKGRELANFVSQASSMKNRALMNGIIDTLNKPTLCYTQRIATSVGYVLVGSAGIYQIECFTPLGRHFTLAGPSFGVGIGAIAAYSMPNADALNALTYQILLYQKPEKRVNHLSHYVSEIAVGPGVSVETDLARTLRDRRDGRLYLYDLRPAVGAGIAVENIHSFLFRKKQSPLYMKLDSMVDLEAMAKTII